MKFDPEGIVRNTGWGLTEGDIGAISKHLHREVALNTNEFCFQLNAFYAKAKELELRMREPGMPVRYVGGARTERNNLLETIQIFLRDNL